MGLNFLGLFLHYIFFRNIRPEVRVPAQEILTQEVERYRKPTRILHWVHGSAFCLLLLTGLAIYLAPKGVSLHNIIRPIHQVVAIIFIAAPLVYLFTNRQATFQGLKDAFTWGKNDIDWLIAVPRYYYLREEDMLPPQGRLNTLQKLWWLLVIFLVPVSIISGAFMWVFGTSVIAEWAAILHDLTFILIGCMFTLHVYFSAVNPLGTGSKNESWRAMITGKVSAHHARSYHRTWYDEINRRQ